MFVILISFIPSFHSSIDFISYLFYSVLHDFNSVGKIVRTKYSQSEWPKILGLVAAGSRLGSMWSALLYGSILRTGISSAGLLGAMGLGAAQGSWRAIYKVSAVMQVIT